jgi:hypothetical protein
MVYEQYTAWGSWPTSTVLHLLSRFQNAAAMGLDLPKLRVFLVLPIGTHAPYTFKT